MMDNKYCITGFIDPAWTGFGIRTDLHYGGGLNISGYAGYLAPETSTTPPLLITPTKARVAPA